MYALPGLAFATDNKDFTPALKPDEAVRQPIEDSLRVNYLSRDILDTNLVQIMVQVDNPPTNMAFDLSLRAGNEIWPVGPVAWAASNIDWWAFDIDLPQNVKTVDAVLTPDALALHKAFRSELYPPRNHSSIKEIWSGPSIILTNISIGSQRLEMCTIQPPNASVAREEAMDALDRSDPIAGQVERDGDLARARAALEQEVQKHPHDARALYNFGCLVEAAGDWTNATQLFIRARQNTTQETLSRLAQRQLRRICAMCLYNIMEKNDARAMYHLGEAYEYGWGVAQIPFEAKHWYRNAANGGDPAAMCRLAAMYEHETGATQHSEKAHAWYRDQTDMWYHKAANLGSAEASQWLASHAQPAPYQTQPIRTTDDNSAVATPSFIKTSNTISYRDWVALYARKNLNGDTYQTRDFSNTTVYELVVTVAEHDGLTQTNPDGRPLMDTAEENGVEVAENGYINHFFYSQYDWHSGGGASLSASEMKRLGKLLEELPPDHSRLPPAGRRLMLQTMDHSRLLTRVYDRANAPEVVWEILSLCQSGIGAWAPTFKYQSAISASQYDGQFLCLTPDRKQILYHTRSQQLQFWDPDTHERVAEIRHPDIWGSLIFSPDSSQAVGFDYADLKVLDPHTWKTEKYVNAGPPDQNSFWSSVSGFTPDGRYFIAQSVKNPMRLYDAQSWRQVDGLAGIPANAAQYFPSPKGKVALYRTSAGTLFLWDPGRQRNIAQLENDVYVQRVAFSPDESLVALVTATRETAIQENIWTRPRICIWRTSNGKFIHELIADTVRDMRYVNDLLWTSDGRSLLVAAQDNSNSNFDIELYDVKNGRHWADLEGTYDEIVGMALLPGTGELVAGFSDGNICFWDFDGILKQVQQFKDSLGHQYQTVSLGGD